MMVEGLWQHPEVRERCAALRHAASAVVQEAVTIQQIPAPTFEEEERARYVERRFRALGLADTGRDEAGNVYARVPGREAGPSLMVTAHLDTVFDRATDLTTRHDGDRLYGPGIGDNSLGVAGLLALAEQASRGGPRRDIWVAANVGEEGLGNLRGMRALISAFRRRVGAVIVLEGGAFGTIIHRGIGVQRRRLSVETSGGHAWSDFGKPSAIHELCRIGSHIAALTVPQNPRTSYNLGSIEGGTSINSIASHASALLDLRSEDPSVLTELGGRVDAILERARRGGVMVQSEAIGDRPAADIPASHPLVRTAVDSLARVGYTDTSLRAASTDANVPLAAGIPTICIGLTVGHHAHRTDEYIELAPLPDGLQHAFLVIWAASELLL